MLSKCGERKKRRCLHTVEMQDQGRCFWGGEELIGGKYNVCLRVRGMQVGTETMNWQWPQLVLPWVFSSFSHME